MLRFLRIEHLAVIDALEVEFEPGLNVLTGETGAGKSMPSWNTSSVSRPPSVTNSP